MKRSKNIQIKRILSRTSLIKYIALAAIFVIAIGLLCYQINRPYCKIWEHGEIEIRARNFLEVGFWELNFLPVRNFFGGIPNYYLNHPPLAVIVLTVFLQLLGDSEFSARLSMITSALASIWLLYKIVQLETSEKLVFLNLFFINFFAKYLLPSSPKQKYVIFKIAWSAVTSQPSIFGSIQWLANMLS